MATKVKTTPRKRPLQARSEATVAVLLDATARVLSQAGYDRASTNRIAEAAGVSIGSLYQYFPSKEALVAALVDRHLEQQLRVFLEHATKSRDLPIREAARAVVAATLDAHLVEPKLHRVLVEQVPRVGKLGKLMEQLDTTTAEVVRAYLEAHRDEVRVKDLEVATFVVVHAVEGIVHRAVLADRASDRDALLDALVDMVARYLARD